MRAIWTGSVSFGLVNIPIKLYSGSESGNGLDLHMLHDKDMSPIRFARICKQDGEEVPYNHIIKGYEYAKDEYVTLSDEDFQSAAPEKTKTIDIVEFTDQENIDIRYFEKPYYLEPQKGADKPYALLREALNESKKVAVATFVLRDKQHLAAIKPVGRALVLNQMRYTNEIREPGELKLPDNKAVNQKEIDMALALVGQLSQPFIPEDFHDTFRESLEQVIENKAKGKKPKPKAKAVKQTKSADLMAVLKASLEAEPKAKPKKSKTGK